MKAEVVHNRLTQNHCLPLSSSDGYQSYHPSPSRTAGQSGRETGRDKRIRRERGREGEREREREKLREGGAYIIHII